MTIPLDPFTNRIAKGLVQYRRIKISDTEIPRVEFSKTGVMDRQLAVIKTPLAKESSPLPHHLYHLPPSPLLVQRVLYVSKEAKAQDTAAPNYF